MTFQPKLTPDQVEELILDYKDGCTVPELSIIYRVSIRTVNRRLVEANVKMRFRPHKFRKRPKPSVPRELMPCGTNAAYQRHRRNGEYPCTSCLEAHAVDVAKAKTRKKKRNGSNKVRRTRTGQ